MPRYLYSYMHLFGYLGHGTPEHPGTDFAMSVWIDADDAEEALRWGKVVLADYIRARFEQSEQRFTATDDDWIEEDEEQLQRARLCHYPACRVGEIPAWWEPWRDDNCRKPPAD
jgi:hypothetical protein